MSTDSFDPVQGLAIEDIEWGRAALHEIADAAGRKTWLKSLAEEESLRMACIVSLMADRRAQVRANPPQDAACAAFGWVVKDTQLAWMSRQLEGALLDQLDIPARPLAGGFQGGVEPDRRDVRDGRSMSLF